MGDGRAAVFGRAPVTHQPFGHLAAILGQLLSPHEFSSVEVALASGIIAGQHGA